MINFKRTYINSSYVKQLNSKNVYNDNMVSFVELNPYNLDDLDTMNNLSDLWECKDGYFAVLMNDDFQSYAQDEYRNYNSKFYCLTKQKSNFVYVDPKEIIGLAEIDNHIKNYCYLQILQTHPDFMHDGKSVKYKYIGSAIVKNLQKMFNKPIIVDPVSAAVNFYKKLGFELLHKGPLFNHYILNNIK